MRKKRILVTGGEGFIGKHLVSRLKEMGHDVITVDLTPGADYEMDICEIRNFEHIPDVDVSQNGFGSCHCFKTIDWLSGKLLKPDIFFPYQNNI